MCPSALPLLVISHPYLEFFSPLTPNTYHLIEGSLSSLTSGVPIPSLSSLLGQCLLSPHAPDHHILEAFSSCVLTSGILFTYIITLCIYLIHYWIPRTQQVPERHYIFNKYLLTQTLSLGLESFSSYILAIKS